MEIVFALEGTLGAPRGAPIVPRQPEQNDPIGGGEVAGSAHSEESADPMLTGSRSSLNIRYRHPLVSATK